METWMLYFLKVNGLIIAFYAMYWLFLKKETFFKSNRWYLILGLISSFVLPLITFTKTVWVESKPVVFEQLTNFEPIIVTSITQAEEPFHWIETVVALYALVALVLILKIVFEIVSFYKNIKNQHRIKERNFTLIHTSKTDNPFSFFNYIIVNQKLFSEEELNHILIHESIHVKQKHSFDVLFSRMICALLWINPIVWLYRKAMIQNLEYIADFETFRTLNNKHAYQKTLLKVIINHNQLPITNHFFQSLIKKRIVMLNTHPSHRNKSWKYAIIIPFLVAFTLLFQIETVAQEKENKTSEVTEFSVSASYSSILTKNTTDQEIQELEKAFTDEKQKLIISNVKRNSYNEIVAIKLVFDFGKPYVHLLERKSNNGINNIKIYVKIDENDELTCGFEDLSHENVEVIEMDGMVKQITKSNTWSLDSMKKKGKDVVMIINGKHIVTDAKVEVSPDEEIDEMTEISASEFERKYNQKADKNKLYYEISTSKVVNINYNDAVQLANTKQKNTSGFSVSYETSGPERNLDILHDNDNVDYKKALILLNGKAISYLEAEQIDPLTISRGIVIPGSEKTQKVYGDKALNGVIMIDTKENVDKNNLDEIMKPIEVDFKINVDNYGFIISKNSRQEDLEFYKSTLAKNNIDLKITGLKRNSLGEITSINIQLKENNSKVQKNIKTDYPIPAIHVGKRNGKIVIEEKN